MKFGNILILGAGGHAKVVIDAILGQQSNPTLFVCDRDESKNGMVIGNFRVTAPMFPFIDRLGKLDNFHVAIGHNLYRQQESIILLGLGIKAMTVVHSYARVAATAVIGEGCFVAANAILGPDSKLGNGCIANHGSVIDHDCIVGDFSHIAPNATLGGKVTVGRRVLVGAGVNILPGVSIGDDCVIGAGAVVVNDLSEPGTYIGTPAFKLIKEAND
jgi:sugar O-acyltransferase (sialic acid O-acetyltransferase NeuD family)